MSDFFSTLVINHHVITTHIDNENMSEGEWRWRVSMDYVDAIDMVCPRFPWFGMTPGATSVAVWWHTEWYLVSYDWQPTNCITDYYPISAIYAYGDGWIVVDELGVTLTNTRGEAISNYSHYEVLLGHDLIGDTLHLRDFNGIRLVLYLSPDSISVEDLGVDRNVHYHARLPNADTLTICRVCGYDLGYHPWGDDGESPVFTFCDCCGTEFGVDDASEALIRIRRQAWLGSGAHWLATSKRPTHWDRDTQLAQIPERFQ